MVKLLLHSFDFTSKIIGVNTLSSNNICRKVFKGVVLIIFVLFEYLGQERGYDMDWLDKKVYVKIRNINRSYSGKVIEENEFSITIIDINGKQVSINKADTSFIQEER